MQRRWMRELVVHDIYHGQPGTRDLGAAPKRPKPIAAWFSVSCSRTYSKYWWARYHVPDNDEHRRCGSSLEQVVP